MRNRLLLGTALLAGSFALADAGQAATIQFDIFDGATLIGTLAPTAGGFATFSAIAPDANFSAISVSATGIPVITDPNFNSVTIDATANGPATLTVIATQVGALNPTGFASTFSVNALTATATVAFANYVDPGNHGLTGTLGGDALAENTLIASATESTVVSGVGPFLAFPVVAGPFSETEVYTISFTGGLQSATVSSAIVGVPEPLSMAVLGTGLLGLGVFRRRKA